MQTETGLPANQAITPLFSILPSPFPTPPTLCAQLEVFSLKALTWPEEICLHPGDRSQVPDREISAFSPFQRTLWQTGTKAEPLQFGSSASVKHQVVILAQHSGLEGPLWSGIR